MDRESLLNRLERRGFSEAIMDAFRAVDRAGFVRQGQRHNAYEDRPLPIGHGQTISQPYTVAFTLSLLGAQAGDDVLDVGAGSGYTTALLAEIVGDDGCVRGLEVVDDLVSFGQRNLAKYDHDHARIEKVEEGVLGDPDGSYDRILVSAAAEELPGEVVDQLVDGGVLVIPVDNAVCRVTRGAGGDHDVERHGGFRFVPLRR